jgi:hypothetical protein
MSRRVLIPFQAIQNRDSREWVINQPARCSRCNADPAPCFETHPTTVKIRRIAHRQVGTKYRSETHLLVRLPLCETCYQKSYLSDPDSLRYDDTPLGKEVRQREKLSNAGGLIAGLGILLLTPFVPESGFLAVLKSNWSVFLILGILLLLITWVLLKRSQARVRKSLEEQNGDSLTYPPADVWSRSIEGEPDPASIALEISLENENWLADFGRLNGWRLEE